MLYYVWLWRKDMWHVTWSDIWSDIKLLWYVIWLYILYKLLYIRGLVAQYTVHRGTHGPWSLILWATASGSSSSDSAASDAGTCKSPASYGIKIGQVKVKDCLSLSPLDACFMETNIATCQKKTTLTLPRCCMSLLAMKSNALCTSCLLSHPYRISVLYSNIL